MDKKVLVSLMEGEAHPLAEDLQQSYIKLAQPTSVTQ
jgi:hypothetical protein